MGAESDKPKEKKRRYKRRKNLIASDVRLFRLLRDATSAAIAADKNVRGCEDDVALYFGSLWKSPQSEGRRLCDPSIAATANQAGKGMDRTTAMLAIAALEKRKYIRVLRGPSMKNSSFKARLKILPIWNFVEIEKAFKVTVRQERDAARRAYADRVERLKAPAPAAPAPAPAAVPAAAPAAAAPRAPAPAASPAGHRSRESEERAGRRRRAKERVMVEFIMVEAKPVEVVEAKPVQAKQIKVDDYESEVGMSYRLARAIGNAPGMRPEDFPDLAGMTPRHLRLLVEALEQLWRDGPRVSTAELIQATIEAVLLA